MKYLKYRPLRPALTAASSALLVFAAACGNPGSESGPESGSPSATSMITVDNCEDTVDVPHPPQRVMVTGSESIPTLAQLGVLDSIAVRAGVFPPAYFDELTNAVKCPRFCSV